MLKEENSALRSELDELKNTVSSLASRMDEKNAQYESEIEALTSVNQEQHKTLSRLRTVATVGLVVSFPSLLGSFGLIGCSLARKKNLPQA